MNVSRYMQRDAVTALPSAIVGSVRRVMEEHGFGLLLIASEEGTLQGFVTRGSFKGVADPETPVERVLHPIRFAVSPDDTLEKGALLLLEHRLVLLPVVDDGERLVGVLTQTDALRGLAEGLGIGREATRLSLWVRHDSSDLFLAFETLRAHGARVLGLAWGLERDDRRNAIIRVQNVQDREGLRQALELALRDSESGG